MMDLGISKGGKLWGGPGKENFEIYDVFKANLPEFCQHLTTRRAMNVNKLSSISKTKVLIQGDTSAAAVAIAIILICNIIYYYAWQPF